MARLASRRASGAAFDGFISYSHAVDGRLAPALQQALEQLARPWLRRRALRVFHDSAGLGATPGLWSTISVALDQARYFVLLASPAAAQSRWVQQELEQFLAGHPAGQILIVLTDGECRWHDTDSDFDWAVTTALPRQLAGVFAEEPLYVDLRWARTDAQLDLHNPRFRQAVADLAAPIHGLPRDEVDAVDLVEFAKARRARRTAVAAVSGLAVVSMVAAGLAVLNAREARAQADASEAGRLAALSAGYADNSTDLAILLAKHSLSTLPSKEGNLAMARAMTRPAAGFEVLRGTATPGATVLTARNPALLDIDAAGTTMALGVDQEVAIWRTGHSEQASHLKALGLLDVRRVDLTNDGQRVLAVGDFSGDLAVLNVASGARVWSSTDVADAAFLPDGQTVVTVSRTGLVRLWSLDGDRSAALRWTRQLIDNLHESRAIEISDDGSKIAIATAFWSVVQLDPATGQESWRQEIEGSLGTLAYNSSGSRLAYGSSGYADAGVLNTDQGGVFRFLSGNPGGVEAVEFSRDGTMLAVGGSDSRIRLFDVVNERLIGELPGRDNAVSGLVAAPDGISLYSASLGGVRRWDLTTGRPTASLVGTSDSGDVSAVAAADDGKLFASATLRRVYLWRRGETNSYASIEVTGGVIEFVPGSNYLAVSGFLSHRVDLYDVGSGRLVRTLASGTGQPLRLWARSGQVTLVSADARVVTWNTETGEVIHQTSLGVANLRGVDISAGGGVVAAATPEGVRTFDLDTGTLLASRDIADRRFQTFSVALNPDGSELAIGLPAGRVVRVDARTGVERGSFSAHTGNVAALAYSPDASMLATAAELLDSLHSGDDGGLRLWDVATGQLIANRVAHDRDVNAVAFSADGRWLLSGSDDAQVLVWAASAEWAARSCAVAGRELTDAERATFLRAADREVRVC